MDVDGYVPIAVLALAAGHIVSDPLGRSSDDSTACHAVGVVVRSHVVNQVDSASVCPSAGFGRLQFPTAVDLTAARNQIVISARDRGLPGGSNCRRWIPPLGLATIPCCGGRCNRHLEANLESRVGRDHLLHGAKHGRVNLTAHDGQIRPCGIGAASRFGLFHRRALASRAADRAGVVELRAE